MDGGLLLHALLRVLKPDAEVVRSEHIPSDFEAVLRASRSGEVSRLADRIACTRITWSLSASAGGRPAWRLGDVALFLRKTRLVTEVKGCALFETGGHIEHLLFLCILAFH